MRWQRLWLTLGWIATSACAPGPLPTPVIQSVSPAEVPASSLGQLTVRVDAVLPFRVNYATGQASEDPLVQVWVGQTSLGEAPLVQGQLSLELPTLFIPGQYDVRLRLADGREAVAVAALTILPGVWPDGYLLDPIPAQRVNVPFEITVRAQGAAAAAFTGNVLLATNLDVVPISPTFTGRFAGGIRVQQVVIGGVNGAVVINVQDVDANQGSSAPFQVLP